MGSVESERAKAKEKTRRVESTRRIRELLQDTEMKGTGVEQW
jgi:hypothetical protein